MFCWWQRIVAALGRIKYHSFIVDFWAVLFWLFHGFTPSQSHLIRTTQSRCHVTSIDMLPDDVLLAVFDFCVGEHSIRKKEIEAWQTLVHVCQQWRTVVFGSPRRLNLRLYCTTKTRVPLDVWPALPLCCKGHVFETEELDNIIAPLECSDRVYHIDLADYSSHLENISAAMQKPFPELTYLHLFSRAETVVPDSFLGGSAPRLRSLDLSGIPVPGLPKLLLSATHLVWLYLVDIPHSGYFSPETIVAALSTLTDLETLRLEFQSPQSFPDAESRRPPPLTRSVIPVLGTLMFKGAGEYLEDLVALIDTPKLYSLDITLFNQIVFDTPQFIQFISRTPDLKMHKEARLAFEGDTARVNLSSPSRTEFELYNKLDVKISCREPDWQVSSLEQVCTSCLPPLSALEDLYIYENSKSPSHWRDNIETTLWLELLHPFSAVKNLYLSDKFALRIAPAMQELVGIRTTEVLPTLQNIFLEGLQSSGPAQEGIVKFVAARQTSGQPITVSLWERDTE